MRTVKRIRIVIFFMMCLSMYSNLFSQENGSLSFAKQNKNKHYTSFAFGMGASYGNNKSLNTFIGYELPNYNTLTESQKLSDFRTGLEFFVNAERQVTKNIGLKIDYGYFIKSNKLDLYQSNSYDYTNHQIYLGINYIIPGEYHFLKFGVGGGTVFSSLDSKSYINNIGIFTSTGILAKAEGTFSVQMGKNLAGYLNGYIGNVFSGTLKDSNGKELKNVIGDPVDLNSFMLGLRLGIEFYIF